MSKRASSKTNNTPSGKKPKNAKLSNNTRFNGSQSANGNDENFELNDQVWVKKLNPTKFWPAFISEIPMQQKSEYKVNFYGSEKNSAYVTGSELMHLNESPNPNRGRLEKNIIEAIEMAKIESKEIKNDQSLKKNSLYADAKGESPIQTDRICSNQQETEELCIKREAAIAASSALTASKTPSQLQQQRTKIKNLKGQELDQVCESTKMKYDQFKSISERLIENNKSQKKRSQINPSQNSTEANVQHSETDSTSLTVNSKNSRSPISKRTFLSQDPNQERPLSVNLKEILKLKSTSLNNLNEISEENKCSKNAKSPISSSRSSSPFSLDLNYRPSEKLTDNDFDFSNVKTKLNFANEQEEKSINSFQFEVVTFVINSSNAVDTSMGSKWLLLYLIEKIIEYHGTNKIEEDETKLQIQVYDIFDEIRVSDDRVSELEIFIETNLKLKSYEIKYVKEFNEAFRTDFVVALVALNHTLNDAKSKEPENSAYEKYEENLFSSDIKDLKYICLGISSHQNAMFFHYYFQMNKAIFVEAPLLFYSKHLNLENYENDLYNNSKLFIATLNTAFNDSIKKLFNWVKQENILDKKQEIGLPCIHINSIKPVISETRKLISECVNSLQKQISQAMQFKTVDKKSECLVDSQFYIGNVLNDLEAGLSIEINRAFDSSRKDLHGTGAAITKQSIRKDTE